MTKWNAEDMRLEVDAELENKLSMITDAPLASVSLELTRFRTLARNVAAKYFDNAEAKAACTEFSMTMILAQQRLDEIICDAIDVIRAEAEKIVAEAEDAISCVNGYIDSQNSIIDRLSEMAAFQKPHLLHPLNCSDTRQRVWDMTGGRCAYCDVELVRGERLPNTFCVEHVVPVSSGGPDNIANYVPSCATCNNSKGPKHVLEFVKFIGERYGRRTTVEAAE